jgi:hypothetical protein
MPRPSSLFFNNVPQKISRPQNLRVESFCRITDIDDRDLSEEWAAACEGLRARPSSRDAVIDRRIEGSIDRVTGAPAPHRAIPVDVKCPAEAGHFISAVMGCAFQAAQPFERQGRRPSALGHNGLWSWIFANRILADRILANRSGSRRRRLSARQIGSGGSAQHRKGCSRCGQNLQHDLAPLKVATTWSERTPLALQWQNAGTETITQQKRGFVNVPWFAFVISVA